MQLTTDWTRGLKLSWSLHFRNTVERTSPGSLVIEKCYYGQLNFEEARKQLCTLRDVEAIDFADITPDGESMLEVSFHRL